MIEVYRNKKNDRSKLFFLCALYYMNSIFNIWIVWTVMQNYLPYFIFFIVYCTITALITLLQVYNQLIQIKFIFLDIFCLGFLYLASNRVKPSFQEFACNQIFNRIPFLLFSQIITFFLLEYLQNITTDWYQIVLTYLSFIFNIFIYLAWIGFKNIRNHSKKFINQFFHSFFFNLIATGTNILVLASFLQFKDNHGSNLGLYFIVLKLLNLILFQFLTPFKSSESSYAYRIFVQFLISIFSSTQNGNLCGKESYNVQNKNITLVGYFNQMTLLLFLVINCLDECQDIIIQFNNKDYSNIFKLVNIIIVIILMIIYLACFTQRTLLFLLHSQHFVLADKKDALQVIDFLQRDQLKTKLLHIDILNIKQIHDNNELFLDHNLENHESDEDENDDDDDDDDIIYCTKSCMINYCLIQNLSAYKKNNVHIIENTKYIPICGCYMLRMVFEEEIVFHQIAESIINKLLLQNKFKIFSHSILYERFTKGFIFSHFSNKLEEQLDYKEKNQIKAEVLKVNCYQLNLKYLMTYSPQVILFDLYDH